jgi:choline dehydrogenase
MHTLKLLMQSGIGVQAELQRLGILLAQRLPGVGKNFQDYVRSACIWEYQEPLPPHNNAGEATFFWKSKPSLSTPDIQTVQVEVSFFSAETEA